MNTPAPIDPAKPSSSFFRKAVGILLLFATIGISSCQALFTTMTPEGSPGVTLPIERGR